MTSDNNKLKLKIHYKDEIKIMTIDSNEIIFDEMIKKITKIFNLNNAIKLHYIDRDNDTISISSTEELKEYVSDNDISTYRIYVTQVIDAKEETIITDKRKNMEHMNNKEIIYKILISHDFSKLLEYSHFDFDKLFERLRVFNDIEEIFKIISEQKNIVVFKYIIDNCVNLECEIICKWRLIHFICRYSTPEMIKYIIDKNVDLECEIQNGWKPIHFICRYSTPEMIKYIIDKNVNLECELSTKTRPIHIICKYSTPEMMKYIIDKGADLECTQSDGWKPIHLVSHYSTMNIIVYMMSKKITLDSKIKLYNGETSDLDMFDLMKLNENIKELLAF